MFGKRKISLTIVFVFVLSFLSFGVIADDNTNTQYATREYTVNEFISAIGKSNLPSDRADLSNFTDSSDIDPDYSDSIALAVAAGLLKGYEDQTLRPKDSIKRVEALAILSRALKDLPVVDENATFSDIPSWAVNDIERLAKAGIVKGYGDGRFGCDDLITVEQVGILSDRIKANGETRLQDDFYAAVNADFLKNTKIPDSYTQVSTAQTLDENVYGQIIDIMDEFLSDDNTYEKGSDGQKIRDFFFNLYDMQKRNLYGIKEIRPILDAIDESSSVGQLIELTGALNYNTGEQTINSFSVAPDPFDSNTYCLYYSTGNFGLSKPEILGESNPDTPAAYQQYLTQLLSLSGESEENAKSNAKAVFDMELDLANTALDSNKVPDPKDYYKEYTEDSLNKLLPNLETKSFMTLIGIPQTKQSDKGTVNDKRKKIIVADENLAQKMNSYMTTENLPLLKEYCKSIFLSDISLYLSSDFLKAYNDFYNVRFGVNADIDAFNVAMNMTQNYLGTQLGEMYVKKYFSEDAKKDVEKMVSQIINAYKTRINRIDWMSQSTKQEALLKLDKMEINVGYPDKFESIVNYVDIVGDEGTDIDNIFTINGTLAYNNYFAVNQEVQKKGWNIDPQTVNAYYDPYSNSIFLPAGILQSPFYDIKASKAENLGGIGTVIAHEISHAFDETGSLYDENGNRKNWWTDEEYKIYDEKSEALVNEFNKVQVLPGHYIDGKLTLGENMADLGGMSCILDLISPNDPNLHLLFEKYAEIYACVKTDTATINDLANDVHSPNKFRVNTILSNFQQFFDCYNIKEGDLMYRPPEERVSIW